jgi:hypothetical protein
MGLGFGGGVPSPHFNRCHAQRSSLTVLPDSAANAPRRRSHNLAHPTLWAFGSLIWVCSAPSALSVGVHLEI